MPHDLPKWNAVYHYFSMWKRDGTWKRIHDQPHGDLRQSAGRNREPSAAIMDSQSVKTTEKGGSTDTTQARRSTGKAASPCRYVGVAHRVVVHPADVQDRDGAKLLLDRLAETWKRLRLIWADGSYAGQLIAWVRSLRKRNAVRVEIVKRSDDVKGFKVLPRRSSSALSVGSGASVG